MVETDAKCCVGECIVIALKQMGENRVAENIHQKYVGSRGKSH